MKRILWIVFGFMYSVVSFALTIPKGTLYFDNSKTNYNSVCFVIGCDQPAFSYVWTMTQDGDKWRVNIQEEIPDVYRFTFVGASVETGYYNQSFSAFKDSISHQLSLNRTATSDAQMNTNDIFVPSSGDNWAQGNWMSLAAWMASKGGGGSGQAKISGTLPVIYVNTQNNSAINDTETQIKATIYIDSILPEYRSLGSPSMPITGTIKGRGNYTWRDFDKKPYKIKFDQKQKVDKKEELIRGLNPLEWMLEFPEVLDNEGRFEGFDIIIGNPPYIEAKKLKGQSAALKDHYEVYSGTADLSVYFIELALRLLKPNGHLCYITTNKFFSNEFGKPVRRIILSNSITHLVNFEQVEVFENVLVSSVILGITSHAAKENKFIYQQFFKLNNEQIKNDFEDKQNSFGSFEQSNLDESEWSFATGASAELKRKLDAFPRLGKLEGVHIYRGVTTGYNPAFIITNEQRDKLIAEDPKNAEIIKNMLQGRNIRKWFYNESEENLLQTGYDMDIEKVYPHIYQHLLQFEQDLVARTDQGKKWYNLRACQYYGEFEKSEKIIWGLTATNWAYTLDTGRHYLPSNGYILTSEILPVRFILGLLNSKVLHQYFKYIGVMTAGGAYTLKAATIEAMPIPDSTPEQRQAIINIVNTILDAKKQDPTTDVAMEEQQIDELVYNLFGLTDEEKELIEQS